MHKNSRAFPFEGVGFEWDVTPDYFNKRDGESDDSDRVRAKYSNK